MKQLCCSCLLWLGLLQAAFSQEQEESKPRRLCGRHLLLEIVKLCGQADWSQFMINEPLAQLSHQSSQEVKTFSPEQIPSSAWGRFTNPVLAPVSQEKAINTWEDQPPPIYQFEKANLFPEDTKEFSSHNANPYFDGVKLQKKRTNKINTFSSLFWGNHPQRERRGFSDKCCLKGCTQEELAVACLPTPTTEQEAETRKSPGKY
ncbi:insulin-like peptide INSL6 isoform X2 [Mesocricetus auratus]|uniref:Insulin-like peptide INSL6 n=1 Tax=Mesocricetus auratus TaxID=10036 RepID=A0A1U7QAZ4_MESAU|nr:insulin-like peptide INSL6 isoform X2 [Mesocricetus auratus]